MLWIAYNFLSLQGSLQFYSVLKLEPVSCELLTIFYLYKVLCSIQEAENSFSFVVNCLQFFIFTRFFAVVLQNYNHNSLLWIAYNFLSLQGSLQSSVCCCQREYVVNCLQFFIFTRFFAVLVCSTICPMLLWIAYNFLSLQGSLQFIFADPSKATVVNCLQFFIFTRFFAVNGFDLLAGDLLWIAYNFLSLQGSLQYGTVCPPDWVSCELLTIFYLYKVLCSLQILGKINQLVVNCLQFFIFTRFFAVINHLLVWFSSLWIAYNFLSLQGSLQ